MTNFYYVDTSLSNYLLLASCLLRVMFVVNTYTVDINSYIREICRLFLLCTDARYYLLFMSVYRYV